MGRYRKLLRDKVTIPEYIYEIVVPNMGSYYSEDYACDFDVSSWIKCCLHDEDTPSFKYYDYSNSFFCFGCRRGGDVVNLHKYFTEKLNGTEITDEEAEAFLVAYFIKRDSTVDITKVDEREDRTEHEDNSDVAEYALYVNNLEKVICGDRTMSVEQKQLVYDSIDTSNQLLSVGAACAEDCLEYIKQKVKEALRMKTGHKKIVIA